MADAENTNTNPHHALITKDIQDRSTWLKWDAEILKRRLGERPRKRQKPYPGAPNAVVRIIDDVTRDKTDQEVTMILNAPRYAHFIPLSEKAELSDNWQELAFDTYLRYIINIAPKIEEADDMKNSRGFTVIKRLRSKHPRWGECPDIEIRDIRTVIVPATCKDIQSAERICDIFSYSQRELEEFAKNPTWNSVNVKSVIELKKTGDRSKQDSTDSLYETEHLIGITTSNSTEIITWEVYCYATDWDVAQDKFKRIKVGDKIRKIFSPYSPNDLFLIEPWREQDLFVAYTADELEQKMQEGKIDTGRFVNGKELPWPFIQPRYENRSRYYYDSRGVGHLCMDEQVAATAELNCKLVMQDYLQLPRFKGGRNGDNISHEPGSYMPADTEIVPPPQIPSQMDFDIEMYKRNAGRRCGAMGQSEFSQNLGASRKIQKTATEVQYETTQGTMVSSASVDRFNSPWGEVFQQLWDDLKRMDKNIPIIKDKIFMGMSVSRNIYDGDFLIVPASSSKTLNPDLQFQRDRAASDMVLAMASQFGVTVNPQVIARDILNSWDPHKASRWLFDPSKTGPNKMPPVYEVIKQLGDQVNNNAEMMQKVQQAIEALGKMVEELDDKNNALMQRVGAVQ